MNIVILHRIPYSKACYGRVIDHKLHEVTYICRQGGGHDLPPEFRRHALETMTFDPGFVASEVGDLLSRCNRLIARSEYDLIAAATLREQFEIPGDKLDDIRPMRDKLVMRQRCDQAGLRQPRFWTPKEFLANTPKSGKFLLKPRLEASSYGIITGTTDSIVSNLMLIAEADGYLVEEFIGGDILHVDGFMSDGELEAAVTSVYVGSCLAYASGAPLGSVQKPFDEAAVALTKGALLALGHQNGSFHLEIIVDRRRQYHFLEVASRVGGAGVAETFELKTGVNLYCADLNYQIFGKRLHRSSHDRPEFYGWFVYPGLTPSATRLPQFDADRWQSNLASWNLNRKIKTVSGAISYAPEASPLSGVVHGNAHELKSLVQNIFRETPMLEFAS